MYGAIIGDIVGSTREFSPIKTKRFELFPKGSDFTDDTVLTVAVAQALLRTNGNQPRFGAELIMQFRAFGRKYPHPMGEYGAGFSNWLDSEAPQPYNSCGNGAAMRVSACGYYAKTLTEALMLAEESASVTHNHPEGIKGAAATAAAVFLARSGKSRQEIGAYIRERFYPLALTLDEIRPQYYFDATCQGTVPQAITAFLESVDFEDAIRNAVSLGGDSDTLAAITGSIAWAYYTTAGLNQELRILEETARSYLPDEFQATLDAFAAAVER